MNVYAIQNVTYIKARREPGGMEGEAAKPKIVFDNYDAVVTKITRQMDDLYIYEFTITPPKQANFIAGQYMSLIVPGSTPAPFSIASSPARHDVIELGIEITGGPHTSKIKLLKEGDHVILRGPFGTFVMQGEKKVCYLAGGVGITPFMSMLRWIRDTHQDDIQATLFYSCKTKDQFLWPDELEQMTKTHTNIRVILTVTREDPPGWLHEKGRINPEMIKGFMPDYLEHTFYSCGPPNLIDAMFGILKEMGVPEDRLKREKW
jgi:glycine betaine catabolism B